MPLLSPILRPILEPILNPILGAGNAVTYLLGPFRFGVDQAAPLASPYTEAGAVGGLTLTDATGKLSTSGGRLNFAPNAGGDPFVGGSPALSRVAGRVLLARMRRTNTTDSTFLVWGVAPAGVAHGVALHASAGIRPRLSGVTFGAGVATYVADTDYELAVVLRSIGVLLLIRGGAYTNWTVLWVDNAGNEATLYANMFVSTGTGTLDDFRVTDLGGSFASDYGIATDRLVSPAINTDSVSEADALHEVNFTYDGSALYYQYRRQDANNCWEVDADSGTLYLYQVTAGVYTARITSGSAFTATNAYRVMAIAAGNVHTLYSNNVSKGTYTDAGNQGLTQTATRLDAEDSGGVASIVEWPRTVTLPNV